MSTSHIQKGNSNLVHTTNININTEIVLFGGNVLLHKLVCDLSRSMMQSRVKFVSQLHQKKFILARQVKLVAAATNCGSRHFICILWWLTHFIFSYRLAKRKKKSNDFISSDNLSAGDVEKLLIFGYCVIVTEVPSTTFCILLIYKLYFIHTFVYLILSKFSSINYKQLSTILLFTILACTLSD